MLEAAGGLGLLGVAVALPLLGAPSVLRALVSLPVVVLVAGRALTGLVLGPERPAVGSARAALVDEGVLRAVTPLLLGVVAALGSVLVLGLVLHPLLGVRVTATSLVLAAAAVAAALHLLAALGRRTVPLRGASHARRRRGLLLRGLWLPALATVLLLVAAVAGARSLQPPRVERYTQLALRDPALDGQGGLVAAPGARVALEWVLRGYDEPLPDHPRVTVTVAGSPATDLRTTEQAAPLDPAVGSATGSAATTTVATAARAGTVSALAPRAPGLYRVVLTVGDGGAAQTLYLVLEVRS